MITDYVSVLIMVNFHTCHTSKPAQLMFSSAGAQNELKDLKITFYYYKNWELCSNSNFQINK